MEKSLKHKGFVYEVNLEHTTMTFVFQDQEGAIAYCKTNYSNTQFQILPIPVFSFKNDKLKEK